MIEGAHQVEAFVGQRKALAMAQHRPRQFQAGDAVHDFGLDRHEVLEVELVRHLEQRPVAVALLALGMMERPGGVARQRLDRRRRRLDLEVGANVFADGQREGKLPGFESILEPRRQRDVGGDLGAVERHRRIGLDRARDVALHEQALAVIERRQRVVAGAQVGRLPRPRRTGRR